MVRYRVALSGLRQQGTVTPPLLLDELLPELLDELLLLLLPDELPLLDELLLWLLLLDASAGQHANAKTGRVEPPEVKITF